MSNSKQSAEEEAREDQMTRRKVREVHPRVQSPREKKEE